MTVYIIQSDNPDLVLNNYNVIGIQVDRDAGEVILNFKPEEGHEDKFIVLFRVTSIQVM